MKKKYRYDENERRENILRPSPYLGYDRDTLGLHLFSRGAYEIALTQFRRAIWLNPYEPVFKEHLARCLHKLGRYTEANRLISNQPDTKKMTPR
jgi:Flp pilus assembly protein TadD